MHHGFIHTHKPKNTDAPKYTIHTYSVMYSRDVQELKSPSGMNFLFIGVSKVTLKGVINSFQKEKFAWM